VRLEGEMILEDRFKGAATEIFKELSSKPGSGALVVAVCGGRSVVGLVKELAQEARSQSAETLKRLHFFMVDERLVPINHPDSNFGGLNKLLFAELVESGAIDASQLHPLRVNSAADGDLACELYLKELKTLAEGFSVVILGMGEDGHVAGLFPRHPALAEQGDRFIAFHDSPKPPAGRMTASKDLITSAGLSVLLAIGEGKREAWNNFNRGDLSVTECPAKMAREARRFLVVTDL
jgi:6-phosphogluconolactonase